MMSLQTVINRVEKWLENYPPEQDQLPETQLIRKWYDNLKYRLKYYTDGYKASVLFKEVWNDVNLLKVCSRGECGTREEFYYIPQVFAKAKQKPELADNINLLIQQLTDSEDGRPNFLQTEITQCAILERIGIHLSAEQMQHLNYNRNNFNAFVRAIATKALTIHQLEVIYLQNSTGPIVAIGKLYSRGLLNESNVNNVLQAFSVRTSNEKMNFVRLLVEIGRNNLLSQKNLITLLEQSTEKCEHIAQFFCMSRKNNNFFFSQTEFEQLVQYATLFGDQNIYYAFSQYISPPMYTHNLFSRLVKACKDNPTSHTAAKRAMLAIISGDARYNYNAVNYNPINTDQSTHTASVHKSVGESASRLAQRYQISPKEINGIIDELEKAIKKLKNVSFIAKQKRSIALKAITRIRTIDHKEPISGVHLSELLALAWIAITDKENRKGTFDDSLSLLIEGLYESQREYNLDGNGNDDNLPEDKPACNPGTFNKIIEKLASIHLDAELELVTNITILAKIKTIALLVTSLYLKENPHKINKVKEDGNLSSIADEIKTKVQPEIMDEFKKFSNEGKLQTMLNSIEHINIPENFVFPDVSVAFTAYSKEEASIQEQGDLQQELVQSVNFKYTKDKINYSVSFEKEEKFAIDIIQNKLFSLLIKNGFNLAENTIVKFMFGGKIYNNDEWDALLKKLPATGDIVVQITLSPQPTRYLIRVIHGDKSLALTQRDVISSASTIRYIKQAMIDSLVNEDSSADQKLKKIKLQSTPVTIIYGDREYHEGVMEEILALDQAIRRQTVPTAELKINFSSHTPQFSQEANNDWQTYFNQSTSTISSNTHTKGSYLHMRSKNKIKTFFASQPRQERQNQLQRLQKLTNEPDLLEKIDGFLRIRNEILKEKNWFDSSLLQTIDNTLEKLYGTVEEQKYLPKHNI